MALYNGDLMPYASSEIFIKPEGRAMNSGRLTDDEWLHLPFANPEYNRTCTVEPLSSLRQSPCKVETSNFNKNLNHQDETSARCGTGDTLILLYILL